MNLLFYWTKSNYKKDMKYGAGYHLNSQKPTLHNVDADENIWAITKNNKGLYVLVSRIVASVKTKAPKGYRYGEYRVWGDLEKSVYFRTDNQGSIEPIIRELSIAVNAKELGQSFQGNASIRVINAEDNAKLETYANALNIDKKMQLLPEDVIEAESYFPNAELDIYLKHEPISEEEKRRKHYYQKLQHRDKRIIEKIKSIYDGRCQICGWDPVGEYNVEICEAHHIHWLSLGGEDKIENLVLLCPNHHRLIHKLKSQFDLEKNAFVSKGSSSSLDLSLLKHGISP